MVCTCEILAGGGLFGQLKSVVINGGGSFWSSQICSHQNFL